MTEKNDDIDELVSKCVLGDIFDLERSSSCVKLAEMCRDEIFSKAPTEVERQKIRHEIATKDAYPQNFEWEEDKEDFDIMGKVHIKGLGEVKRKYNRNKLWKFSTTYNKESYIEDKIYEPFGSCYLSLYGLEDQFLQQMTQGFYQTKSNTEATKTAESMIFAEHPSQIRRNDPFEVRKHFNSKLDSDTRREIGIKILADEANIEGDFNIRPYENVDRYLDDIAVEGYMVLTERQKDILASHYDDYLEERNIEHNIEKTPYVDKYPRELERKRYDICNKVTNPLLPQNKYKICSSVGFNQDQIIYTMINKKRDKGFDASNWTNIAKLAFRDIWVHLTDDFKNNIINTAINISDERTTFSHRSHIIKNELELFKNREKDWTHLSQETILCLREAGGKTYKRAEIVENLQKVEDKYDWTSANELDCYHNFLDLVSTHKDIQNRAEELDIAYQNGEITKEEFLEATEALKQRPEWGYDLTEGESTKQGYKKVSKNMPMRFRLWASQNFVNDCINIKGMTAPADEAFSGNTYVEGLFRKTLNNLEWENLKKNELVHKLKDIQGFEIDPNKYDIEEMMSSDNIYKLAYEEWRADELRSRRDSIIDEIDEDTDFYPSIVDFMNELQLDTDEFFDIADIETFICHNKSEALASAQNDELVFGSTNIGTYRDEWKADSILAAAHYIRMDHPELADEDIKKILQVKGIDSWIFEFPDLSYYYYIREDTIHSLFDNEMERRSESIKDKTGEYSSIDADRLWSIYEDVCTDLAIIPEHYLDDYF